MMKRIFRLTVFFLLTFSLISCGGGGENVPAQEESGPIILPLPSDPPSLQNVLVLYDTAGFYQSMGKAAAILLQNLLGHFPITITVKPAEEYLDNEIVDGDFTTIFYLGTTYDVLSYYANSSFEYKSYTDFFTDLSESDKTVVWINYNLESLIDIWNQNSELPTTFEQQTGYSYYGVVTNSKYNRINYKNTELYKGVIPFATPGTDTSNCLAENVHTYACETELNIIEILNPSKVKVFASSYSTFNDDTP